MCLVSAGKKEQWTTNETMTVGYESVRDRDYSRACMPRVSRNRRKYAVNLTATTVAHHLSLERVRLSSWAQTMRKS